MMMGSSESLLEGTAEREGDRGERADDPVAVAILAQLSEVKSGQSVTPEAVARAFAASRSKKEESPELWRRYLLAVRQQALHLARAGRIVILRKGKPADPHAPIKGLIRLSLPSGQP